MRHKKILLTAAGFGCAAFAIVLALGQKDAQSASIARGSANSFGMTLDSSKNKLYSDVSVATRQGEATLKTDLGNDIEFAYCGVMGLKNTWHILGNGGYVYNVDPIHGLESINLTFNTDDQSYKILYSRDPSFDQSADFTSSTSDSLTFDFNGYQPSYFKILNTSGNNINISSVKLSFSCLNNYPYLSLSSEDEAMGSVSGAGTMTPGEEVTIEAAPNQGYKFVGWYSNGNLISDEASYTFTAGNADLAYFARFTYDAYNLVVGTESEEKGSVSSSSGSYNYLSQVSITATANPGYTFEGWYSESTLVSSENPYSFSMPSADTTCTAKFSTNSYEVKLNNANEGLGSVSGAGSFLYKSSVTLTASPNTGASFLGWYSGDELISSSLTYTFEMPYENLEYTAKFAWTPYTVELSVNNAGLGSVSGDGSYIYRQQVTLSAAPAAHCSFAGWYDGDDLVSVDNPYVFSLPDKSLSYNAKFVKNHTITVENDDEQGSVTAPSEWGEGLEATVSAVASKGYAFDYWADDNLNILSRDPSYTFTMPNEDVTLYPFYTTGYTLSLSSNDESKGTVSGSGQYKAGASVTATMSYISGTFKGWYSGDELVSTVNPYTFEMPSSDLSLEARFMTNAERRKALGIDPVIDTANKTLTYGLYPQTHVRDSATLTALDGLETANSNGWYLLDGAYYAKTSSKYYRIAGFRSGSYVFDDGTSFVEGTTYWFKCEPITWRVLSSSNGKYSLVSTVLLDEHRYNASWDEKDSNGYYANNYERSEIKSWLNGDFFNKAFSLGNSLIQTTLVDNSVSTTDSTSNSYACGNTKDKVYLLSYQDYCNTDYFADSTARGCKTTDWARANGAYSSSDSSFLYNGDYWTRSPKTSFSAYVSLVSYTGEVSRREEVSLSSAVRPAITIKIA